MRRLEFKNSFTRFYKLLSSEDQIRTDKAIQFLMASLEAGHLRHGLGIKKLRGDIWQIRVDSRIRVCFKAENNVVRLILVGNHEDIRNFLKNI
ncbi:MAG: hypothetical protein HY592_01975 [Candidatus Omnitrophica bacterium]|nr:hypothetical protein [Candidatus Omnitrophota bacterium]